MKIEELRHLFASLPQQGVLAKLLQDDKVRHICLNGLVASAPATFFAAFAEQSPPPILFILDDADAAGYFYNDLKALGIEALLFPSSYRRAVKYGQRDAGSEILRTETMAALATQDAKAKPLYIVTEPSALAERVVSKEHLDDNTIRLETGQQVDVVELQKRLRTLGFQEVDYVYEPGQFAVRGSILDIYSYSSEYPFRVDFFGDEIDTLRTFEVETQLSLQKRQQLEIVPELAKEDNGRLTTFLQLLPKETLIVTKDIHYVADCIGKVFDEGFSKSALAEQTEGKSEMEQETIRQQLQAESKLAGRRLFLTDTQNFKLIETGCAPTHTADATINCPTSPQTIFHKNFDLLIQTLRNDEAAGRKVFILADSQKQTERLREIFASKVTESGGTPVSFTPVDRTLHEGFNDETLGLSLYTDHQIFDRFHKYTLRSDKAKQGKMALTMKELREMEPGDFVVHVDLGIGKFAGLVRVPTGNSYQEMIRLVYQHGDIADVSIHSLYKISKYRSAETGEPPRLSLLGSGAWNRLKEKAKKRIKDIARDLIKLYAKRRHERGFAFSPDNYMQHELEASFLYEDTPDQLKSTQQVKHDMESPRPMDRLVCGDVGFGKTEVAIRAAFKAVCDNKQVAVLVPTTVLAFQHFKTFSKRLQDMPVRVDYLSRARTAKQTRQVTEDLAAGKIDILVGTHKLIGKSVKWKDLGLLIIDEEQKFGVATKEKLRQLKTNVDTLTLSATPIPRTLQFSLMGARDMSIMRTPPPNRYPIQTEISTFSSEVIADAINFEMSRGGQVFFVNDRIAGLAPIAELIHKYVPDCRVGIGHGQMSPEELEKVVMGFMNYDYDVLLSTTIVENGIDIPNANTIIINDAHRFGLSDLHQMRGRVGRSNKKAFCYLLAPPLANLPADARRRLEALETFSELGSGFSIAMQDLDIRGAGNLLGAEQSGFMEDLGYETYQKILSQAVTELRNDEFQDLYAEQIAQGEAISGDDFVDDCAVESDLEMYFPDNYVPGSSERMLLYRELDNMESDKELEAYRQRLIDRFGPVPKQGEELMLIVPLRRMGRRLGCEKIILRQGRMQMQFVSNVESPFYQSTTFGHVIDYIGHHPRRCNLKEKNGKRWMIVSQVDSVREAVKILRGIDAEDK